MDLLAEFIQPLTHWLQQNPNWSFFITFMVSLSESLAIIGSIVPGSVTMTALGILAGSGILSINLTLIAAILGAIAGDSLSYFIGSFYSEKLVDMWPFKKYPRWIIYGKTFFESHGSKSVLIGRFIGPLRSLIPIIAGIMHMPQWQFLIANVISAIGWSLLYVMPGIIIGIAGHELSPESATKLFLIILIILGLLWLIGFVIKITINKLQRYSKLHLNSLWLRLNDLAYFGHIIKILTPRYEKDHFYTASLFLISMISLFAFLTTVFYVCTVPLNDSINIPIDFFINSIQSLVLKKFFFAINEIIASPSIFVAYVICTVWFISYKEIRFGFYILFSVLISTLLAYVLSNLIDLPRPSGILVNLEGSSFPMKQLLNAIVFYGLLLFYINSNNSILRTFFKWLVITILAISGIGSLYLRDYWLTDILASYLIGIVIVVIAILVYRANSVSDTPRKNNTWLISTIGIGLTLSAASLYYVNLTTFLYNHNTSRNEFIVSKSIWWNQNRPILPLYRLNRVGKKLSLLNIQYCGNINLLEKQLTQTGWITRKESFFTNLLSWLDTNPTTLKSPFFAQLYNNKPPSLVMMYVQKKYQPALELRLWESNYHVLNSKEAIWIGSVHSVSLSKEANPALFNNKTFLDPLPLFKLIQSKFEMRTIVIPKNLEKKTIYTTKSHIILIKQNYQD